jgi:hypothetical protein
VRLIRARLQPNPAVLPRHQDLQRVRYHRPRLGAVTADLDLDISLREPERGSSDNAGGV